MARMEALGLSLAAFMCVGIFFFAFSLSSHGIAFATPSEVLMSMVKKRIFVGEGASTEAGTVLVVLATDDEAVEAELGCSGAELMIESTV